jgi:hypothetical protein
MELDLEGHATGFDGKILSIPAGPITSREIYIALVHELARQEYWERLQRFDYSPEMISIVFRPQTETKSSAMYFPEPVIIEIYRRSLTKSIDSEVVRAAAQAPEPVKELVFFAHEFGHHLCVLFALGTGTFDLTRPTATYREEVLAWLLARRLLAERFFFDWHDFEQSETESLEGYRKGLNLSPQDAAAIHSEAVRALDKRLPASSGLQEVWRSLSRAPRS